MFRVPQYQNRMMFPGQMQPNPMSRTQGQNVQTQTEAPKNGLIEDTKNAVGMYKSGKDAAMGGRSLYRDVFGPEGAIYPESGGTYLPGGLAGPQASTGADILGGSDIFAPAQTSEITSAAANIPSGAGLLDANAGLMSGADLLGGTSAAVPADALLSTAPLIDSSALAAAGGGAAAAAPEALASGSLLGASALGPIALGGAGIYGLGKLFKFW